MWWHSCMFEPTEVQCSDSRFCLNKNLWRYRNRCVSKCVHCGADVCVAVWENYEVWLVVPKSITTREVSDAEAAPRKFLEEVSFQATCRTYKLVTSLSSRDIDCCCCGWSDGLLNVAERLNGFHPLLTHNITPTTKKNSTRKIRTSSSGSANHFQCENHCVASSSKTMAIGHNSTYQFP